MRNLFLLAVLAIGCTDGYYTDRDYARLTPLNVSAVTQASAFASIEIFHCSVPMTDHGFLISATGFPTITEGTKISLGARTEIGTFTHNFTFAPSDKYYIRAYVVSPGYVVYSTTVQVNP